MATLKFAVFYSSVTLMWRQMTTGNCRRLSYDNCFFEAKLCLRNLILLLFFSQTTPLHWSAREGHLEISRLLVESKANVAAMSMCFSPPPPSHHRSLTIRLAALTKLHSNWPSTTTKPTSLHTSAVLARCNDVPPRPIVNTRFLLVASVVWQRPSWRGGGKE
jgi:hypothetical protein